MLHHARLSGSNSVVQEAKILPRNLKGNLQNFPLLDRHFIPKLPRDGHVIVGRLVLEAGVEVLHEGLPARGDVAAREEEVHDTMLRPTERIRVTHAGHEREPIKITNSSSGVPVLNVK